MVFPCPITITENIGLIFIFNLSLSCTLGNNSSVMAAFVQFSHSFCHCSLASYSISLYNILFGIPLKAIVVSLLRAASLLADQPVHFRILLRGVLPTRILSSNYTEQQSETSIDEISLVWLFRGC